MIMDTAHQNVVETRPWSDLPQELLSKIADGLGIIELLGFRATCKSWYSASSTASAEVESSPNRMPWFLTYEEGSRDNCRLYNVAKSTEHSINIPQLEDHPTCLASSHGWLLLFNEGHILFLCPFTGATIELPQFPHWEIINTDHVAIFSAPPTSQNCIVCVINRFTERKMELYIVKRRETKWKLVAFPGADDMWMFHMDKVTGAAFSGKCFCFVDKDKNMLTYSVDEKKEKQQKWDMHWMELVDPNEPATDDTLSFRYYENYLMGSGIMRTWLNLREDESISTCGTFHCRTIFHNEEVEAAVKEGETRKLRGIWLHPRFHQVPANQSW